VPVFNTLRSRLAKSLCGPRRLPANGEQVNRPLPLDVGSDDREDRVVGQHDTEARFGTVLGVRHLGAQVTKLPLARESDYTIDWQRVADAVRDNTRLLILCYPNNPLGVTLSRDDWEQLERLRESTGIHVLIDEEYLTDYQASVFCRLPGSYAASSLSKIYGFPGLRLGWFVGDEPAVNRMVNLKRYTTVCNSSICEYFALQVLGDRRRYVERYERLRDDGLDVLRTWLRAQPQLALIEPQGTPFAYLKYHGPGTSADFCRRLLQQKGVLLMPAEVFEDQQAVRLTFGRPRDVLNEGLSRINALLEVDSDIPD